MKLTFAAICADAGWELFREADWIRLGEVGGRGPLEGAGEKLETEANDQTNDMGADARICWPLPPTHRWLPLAGWLERLGTGETGAGREPPCEQALASQGQSGFTQGKAACDRRTRTRKQQ
jgi:hypothetical protein